MIARKNLLTIFLMFFAVLLFQTNARAQLSISLPDASGTVGETIQIPVTVSELTEDDGVTSFEFNIVYDTNFVFLSGVESSGTLTEDGFPIDNPNYAPGKLRVAYASVNPIVGSGTLIYIEAQLNAVGQTNLDWENPQFFGPGGVAIDLNPSNGSITIGDIQPLQAPNLISPQNGATNVSTSTNLYWEAVADADHYNLQVAKDNGFSQVVVSRTNLNNNIYSLSNLDYETTYYWRVNAENVDATSDWSSVWNFTTEAQEPVPDQTNLVYPEDGQTLEMDQNENFVELSWDAPAGQITAYQLDVAFDGTFMDMVFTDNTLQNTTYTLNGLQDNETYYWRVRAKNATGWGEYSEVWSFSTLLTGVEDNGLISDYKLDQNFPNPFNPSTTISYNIPELSNVKLEIFNLLGQYIATLVNTQQASGTYSYQWNPEGLSSGIYIYRLEAVSLLDQSRQFIEVKSMTLMK